jgi:diguanylate cyclase (GGDEF)-like protein
MRLRFRTLESRIVTLFLVLILLVQLAGFFVIRQGIDNNEQASIRDQLALGIPLFKHLLDQKATEKLDSARVLAKDTAFKSAIATLAKGAEGNKESAEDKETIESLLSNSGDRIKASLTLLVSTDRQITASTAKQPPGSLEHSILQLIDKADQSPSANEGEIGLCIFNNQPYQLVVVPIKYPITVGWVAMAFPLDKRIAKEMLELSSLDVTFLVSGKEGNWIADASTLSDSDAMSVAAQLHGVSDDVSMQRMLRIADSDYSIRILPLATAPEQSAAVVLQRSIDAAKAPYLKLQMTMLEITGLLILVSIATSFFAAKRIAGPLRDLTETAKRLGDGNYEGQVVIKRDDEIGKLSKAFESMRNGIAKRELEIRRLAYWDPLTDLPNRAQFALRLEDAIKEARKQNNACYVLMMDLDRFKNVNDVLGHSFGDALLQQVANRLTKIVGATYQVARLGGDEFAVLMPFVDLTEAKAMASRILKSLETPIALEDQTVDLGAGVGIAGFPSHGVDAESLLSRAEVAMYAAKISGNEAVLYAPVLDKTSQESLSLLSELRRALDRDEFRLFVQPKLSLATGALVGLEALVRWQHPERGMIYPDHFIPFSEKTGFIRVLTRWMLEQSAMLCRDLQVAGVTAKISVNLSARDLLDQNLPQKFSDVLKRYEVDAGSFCLEITESSIMDDPLRAQVTLEGLHAMGVDLSIDDFGTGYSSLAYLKRLPVDELKIDKSFVMNMERDIDDAKIVRSTIDLGHNMGLRVVAEGIESEAVWQILAKMGCDQGQGYFMSRPIAADQLIAWIAQWAPPRHYSELQKNLA